jgi:hypothetical protein
MKRYILMSIIKMCAKSALVTTVIGVVIGVIGYVNKWDSSIKYSNAFFLAGCLVIIAGGFSKSAAGEDWSTFQLLSAESFRGMSSSERANFIINASSSISTLVLGVLSGILLILISLIIAYLL